ncbi:PEP-CTERM sorting domain-containing protein [Solimicrobium silvestre]|nr:PEP-CTERM sorting domain-containing protein [Solimicrobium silvestre]
MIYFTGVSENFTLDNRDLIYQFRKSLICIAVHKAAWFVLNGLPTFPLCIIQYRNHMNLTLKRVLLVLALSVASLWVTSATAQVLNFAGLKGSAEEPVLNYYNGGLGGDGSGPGTNYGITFSANALTCSGYPSGVCNTGEIPGGAGANAVFFLSGAADTMDVLNGFNTGFSFYYSSPSDAAFVNVWSGLDDTGTLLATIDLPLTKNDGDSGCGGTNFCPYDAIGVTFAGNAQSVDFGGAVNEVAFADVTIGSQKAGQTVPSSVPEPVSLWLFGIGLAALGLLRRRKAG